MRIVGFLAAVLVLFSFLMPWFQTEKWYGTEQITMMEIVKGLYSNVTQIEETVKELNQNPTNASMLFLSYVVGVSLILIGALFGLTGGRGGHLLGIIGMALLTYPLWVTTGKELFNIISYGYIVGGIGFLIGLVGGGKGGK
ncbi:amino acid permease [Thermococcus sp.]|uniref:amino acid permease n=1 Tax=Thermococcus sp. TaxID=35749 RepID=UPI002602F7D7|nr:amino acid permease [Thermococcus sp.]